MVATLIAVTMVVSSPAMAAKQKIKDPKNDMADNTGKKWKGYSPDIRMFVAKTGKKLTRFNLRMEPFSPGEYERIQADIRLNNGVELRVRNMRVEGASMAVVKRLGTIEQVKRTLKKKCVRKAAVNFKKKKTVAKFVVRTKCLKRGKKKFTKLKARGHTI